MESQRIQEAGVADVAYCTPSEIARLAGVNNSAVTNWTNRDVGFPKPAIVSVSGKTRLWDWYEVKEWLENRRQVDLGWMKEYL